MNRMCERKTRIPVREAAPGRRRVAAFLLAAALGCGAAEAVAAEDPGKAQAGDLVSVNYSVTLPDGAPVRPAATEEVVLVLHAAWCHWSKKLFGESLEDPRVRVLSDRFVWVKVDAGLDKAIGAKYAQKGFPLILLLSPDGDVVGRIDGFREGPVLSGELSSLLKGKKEGAS